MCFGDKKAVNVLSSGLIISVCNFNPSQGDDSVYSISAGSEEYSSLLHHPSSYRRMTRLDPPPHRTSPRSWTEVSQSRRDGFGQIGFSHGEENTNIQLPSEQLVVLLG